MSNKMSILRDIEDNAKVDELAAGRGSTIPELSLILLGIPHSFIQETN